MPLRHGKIKDEEGIHKQRFEQSTAPLWNKQKLGAIGTLTKYNMDYKNEVKIVNTGMALSKVANWGKELVSDHTYITQPITSIYAAHAKMKMT